MQQNKHNRPYVLSIAGFDPSGGAGLVADAKTMEAHGVYGLTVCTSITVQHESVFEAVEWVDIELIKRQTILLIQKYPVNFCKIGLIQDWLSLTQITALLLELNPKMKIIVDPIFKASAGFDFHQDTQIKDLESWLQNIYLLTPNALELNRIGDGQKSEMDIAKALSQYCRVLYKGGHNETEKGTDYLLIGDNVHQLLPQTITQYSKHGSGCVLSAAIVSNLALGHDLVESCVLAKTYISQFLDSNETLLGYHF